MKKKINKDQMKAWVTKTRSQILVRSQVLGPKLRGHFEKIPPIHVALKKLNRFRWLAWALGGFLVAEVAMIGLGAFLTPKDPPKAGRNRRVVMLEPRLEGKSNYNTTLTKNIFCPGCPIPELEIKKIEKPKDCNTAEPARGGLKLIGTIVLSDPQYSVATLSGAGSENIAVQKDDEVPGNGTVFEIRQNRVCILTPTDDLVFIDLPVEDIKFGQPIANDPSYSRAAPAKTSVAGIEAISETEFNISRNVLLQKLSDPNLLFQAHAVPQRGKDGAIECFKILSMQPGSVYESLGVKVGDCIDSLNGEPLTNIAKVQEFYNNIRTASDVSIGMKRNGQKVENSYSIK
ncbi:hypothetical protein GW916_06535 [bacterium]|nr:hypothetical protein [bacterium]